ncbi:MAG: InlB B-repeat-containing protein [Oscillospiraceae bacterium]|nr:InlB B-repeat-containing protein [Oscillospiraceae bacterium]
MKKIMSFCMGIIILITSLTFTIPVQADYTININVENVLKDPDSEQLFANYTNFKLKYVNEVKTWDVFLFFFGNPEAMLKNIATTGQIPDSNATRFMNDVEAVKPILRDAIGAMTNNKDIELISKDDKNNLKLIAGDKILDKFFKDSGYDNTKTFLDDLIKTSDTIEAVINIFNDYAPNILMLESIKDIFPADSASIKMIDELEQDYSNPFFAAINVCLEKGIKKVFDKVLDPLGIYGAIQKVVNNKKAVKGLEYVIYSSTLQTQAVLAYRKTVVKIQSGNYTDLDVINYINAFELARTLTLKLYEKMLGNYNISDEYVYIAEQISNLNKMTYDRPIKTVTFSEWLKTKTNLNTVMYAIKDDVPVRAKADSADTIIKYLKKDTTVTVIDRTINSKGNLWYKVANGNWIFCDNLTPAKPVPANGGAFGGDNNSGGGGFRGSANIDAPTVTATQATDTTGKVSWNAVSGASYYEAQYQSPNTNNSWVNDTDYKNNTATFYNPTRMGNGITYYFRVRAVSSTGETSDWSNIASYTHIKSTVITQSPLTVISTIDGQYNITIPANYTLDCYSNPTDKTRTTIMSAKSYSYNLYCTKQVNMSDGTTWYFFHSGDNLDLYFKFINSMSLGTKPTPTQQTTLPPPTTTTPVTTVPTAGMVTIQYNANGGSGAPSSQTVQKDNNGNAVYTLSTVQPTKNGYTFNGWLLFNDVSYGMDYAGYNIRFNNGNVTSSETLIYYAQWQAVVSTTTTPNDNKQWDDAVILNSVAITVPYSDGTIGYMYNVFDSTKNVTLNNAILINGSLKAGDNIKISLNANGTYDVKTQ